MATYIQENKKGFNQWIISQKNIIICVKNKEKISFFPELKIHQGILYLNLSITKLIYPQVIRNLSNVKKLNFYSFIITTAFWVPVQNCFELSFFPLSWFSVEILSIWFHGTTGDFYNFMDYHTHCHYPRYMNLFSFIICEYIGTILKLQYLVYTQIFRFPYWVFKRNLSCAHQQFCG